MAQVEKQCVCTKEGCDCPNKGVQWVDKITEYCRRCETSHVEGLASRWGPKRDRSTN